jgi:hypothetical protein
MFRYLWHILVKLNPEPTSRSRTIWKVGFVSEHKSYVSATLRQVFEIISVEQPIVTGSAPHHGRCREVRDPCRRSKSRLLVERRTFWCSLSNYFKTNLEWLNSQNTKEYCRSFIFLHPANRIGSRRAIGRRNAVKERQYSNRFLTSGNAALFSSIAYVLVGGLKSFKSGRRPSFRTNLQSLN